MRDSHRILRAGLLLLGLATGGLAAGCGSFDVTDPNNPTLDDQIKNPTKAKLAFAATGIFIGARGDIDDMIWRLGSLGREGANLAGNNQPDYQEPFFGPLSSSQFGGAIWGGRYANIRSINVYLDAVPRAPDLAAEERAASIGFAKTMKALALSYVVVTRANLGAPVDVDRPVSAAPAPWVTEDSVYGAIIGLLDEARDSLANGGGEFPFHMPPGYAGFDTPATFVQFNRALAAKAWIFRATATPACGATCYNAAVQALNASFISSDPADFAKGVYFDYSDNPGDAANPLSEPLNGTTFFALNNVVDDAQLQAGGQRDRRVLEKISFIDPGDTTASYTLSGFPFAVNRKFTVYFAGNGPSKGPSDLAPIPVIRDEELVLLRAEAEIGLNQLAQAITDLNLVRQGAGNLPATTLTPASPASAFLDELLYNRRYSLLWEQGSRWVDARRYGRLGTIPVLVPNGEVPARMPIPLDECAARFKNQTSCNPLGT
jgi:hypothetical protein